MSNDKGSAKKVEAKIGIKDEPETMRPLMTKKKYLQGQADLDVKGKAKREQPSSHEKLVKPGHIVSRLDHQVILSYNGDGLCVAPRGKELVANMDLIGALPRGVFVVPAPNLTEK